MLVWITILIGLLLLYPLRSEVTRLGLLGTCTAAIVCATLLVWPWRWFRWVPAGLVGIGLIFLLLPGRPPEKTRLRQAYINSLASYEGKKYVWGGENWRGVDCSGLLRAAMVDAYFTESIRTLNPALARRALWFWWHDAPAREMSDGYQGETVRLGNAVALKEVPGGLLEPGDLAVTQDGSHVLAYLGNEVWIEADPYVNRVIRIDTRTPNSWSIVRVIPCRWRCFY